MVESVTLRRTRKTAAARILGVLARDTAVTAYDTIGNTTSCQAASSRRTLRRPSIGLWSISSKSGVRS
jgi:hypothetical protein